MSTPHIELNDKSKIAKTVLMPGDPLRAKFIADTYLENVEKINTVRNMFGYTGTYKGKKVTVMGSGMGMPSIGIYSYELYNEYDVEKIIRVGSCGSYSKDINVYDVIIVNSAYSESSYADVAFAYKENVLDATIDLNEKLELAAKKLAIPYFKERIHSSDVFYRAVGDVLVDVRDKFNCVGVEMESFALFANAKHLNKKAACILTVSDSFITHEVTTAYERQTAFDNMMLIALESIE